MLCDTCGRELPAASTGPTCPECLRDIIVNAVPDDEEEDDDPAEPEEGDWVTFDYLSFYAEGGKGRIVVPFDNGPTEPDWRAAVRRRMDQDQFWPNVWFISDHGNAHLLSLEDDE